MKQAQTLSWALSDSVAKEKKGKGAGEVDEGSSEDEGVKGEALVGLSQPYS